MEAYGYTSVIIPQPGMIFTILGKQYEAGKSRASVYESGKLKAFTTFYPVNDEGDRTDEPHIEVDHDFVDMIAV